MEVGKKYLAWNGRIFTPEAMLSDGSFAGVSHLTNDGIGWGIVVRKEYFNQYTEIKEPKIYTKYIHWVANEDGEVLTLTTNDVNPPPLCGSYVSVKTDKVTYEVPNA